MKAKCSVLSALKCCTRCPACGYSLSSFFRWMTPCGHTWWLHSFFLELHQTEVQWVEHSWTLILMLESLNGKQKASDYIVKEMSVLLEELTMCLSFWYWNEQRFNWMFSAGFFRCYNKVLCDELLMFKGNLPCLWPTMAVRGNCFKYLDVKACAQLFSTYTSVFTYAPLWAFSGDNLGM